MSVPLSPYSLRHDLGDVIKERYTVRAILGAGAFGTVYRVEETLGARTLTLACKEMHVMSDPATTQDERADALRMFQEEAYLLQTLRHPNIPAAYFEPEKGVWLACPTCGRTFKGVRTCPDHGNELEVIKERYYLIMDFIEGPDLEELLMNNHERPLEETRVVDYALQVCDALSAVHAKDLSHRDIKPANIKLQKDTDRAMLIDFGLVKPSAVAGGYGTVLKRASTGLGTLGYAPESPQEQARPDARTDILALGMTLYRLLSGLDPTEPDELQTMRKQSPKDLNLKLSDSMDAIIKKMIATNPDDRYPDVAAVKTDLRTARYPIETRCASCGHIQRSATAPTADTRCEQCGRPLQGATTTRQTVGSAPNGTTQLKNQNPNAPRATGNARGVSNTVVPAKANPYEQRLQEIRRQIDAPPVAPAHPVDTRIQEIEAQLARVSGMALRGNTCPSCAQAELVRVTPEPNGGCPLCLNPRVERRQIDNNQCAVCRTGKLHTYQLRNEQMFCSICRHSLLVDEHRKKLGGLLDDLWGNCPNCKASFDILGRNSAKLEEAPSDPFGIAAQYIGQTLPVTQWRELSQRADEYAECDNCHAQFDRVAPDQRRLSRAGSSDPYVVWAHLAGQTLPDAEWGKLAAGLELPAGNIFCPQCETEWNYVQANQTLELVRSAKPLPDWAANRGGQLPIVDWYLHAGGKTSGNPGMLCPHCKTEFDNDPAGLRLVASPSASLMRERGRVLDLRDWQRRAQDLPTEDEIARLRRELAGLIERRQGDIVRAQQQQRAEQARLQTEWIELLRRAVIEGYIPLRRMSGQAPHANGEAYVSLRSDNNRQHLRASEVLRWESPANMAVGQALPQLSWQGLIMQHEWSRYGAGTLSITGERLLFNAWRTGEGPWQCSISQIRDVQSQLVQDVLLVVLQIEGMTQLIGFEIGDAQFDIIYGGQSYTISFSPLHLVTVLKLLKDNH